MKNDLLEKLKKILDYYDNDIAYSLGNPEKISMCCRKPNYKKGNIFVLLNVKKNIAVLWNLENQRKENHYIKTQSLSKYSWDNILPKKDEINTIIRHINGKTNNPREKILAMDFKVLLDVIDDIYELFEFESDNNMEDYSNEIDKYTCDHKRLKRTSESYNRDAKFRKKVLKRYKNQCAICRCNEVKILEAAHIKPVYENGSDNPENGICLCRNHHKMFDSDLIKINFQKNELSFIEDSVKQMPWYKEFKEKYNGKLLKIK